jgi:hypothetical protein
MCYKKESGSLQVLYPLGTTKNVLPGYEEFLDYLMRLFFNAMCNMKKEVSLPHPLQCRMVVCF